MRMGIHLALSKTFHAQKNRTRPGMMKIGLSPGQPKVLSYLSRHSRCMQKEIAEAFDIEPATVSQILSKMEQQGLVLRAAPAARRRAESLRLTEKGKRAYGQWLRLCSEVEAEALKGFTADETQRFLGYLGRMYRNLTGRELA